MSAGAITGAAGLGGGSGGQGFAGIKSTDFIRIMITELTRQDPFSPQDTAKLLEQLSSIRNIESQLGLEQQISSLVLQNQIAGAGNLIGKLVAGLDAANQKVVGLVTSVRVQDGKAVLELDTGASLEMARVTQIANHSE